MFDTTRTSPISGSFSPKWNEKAAEFFVDALGVSAWDESYGQTFGYRWRGEDTLTWGNVDEWILIKWLFQRFFGQGQLQDDLNYSVLLAQQEVDLRTVINETRIAKLEAKYTLRNSNEIRMFLIEHKQVLSVLWDARSIVEEFFGNDVSIDLELVNDPESYNSKQLFGYINAKSLSPDEAFERLSAFDEAWFLKQLDLTGGLFNFNLE